MGSAYVPTNDPVIDPSTGLMTDPWRRYQERVGAAITPGASNEVLASNGSVLIWKLLTNANFSAAAAIDWTKVSKTASSLADLATRSAADLTSGTLPLARLPVLTFAQLPVLTQALLMWGSGSVAAGATVYIGPLGENATETSAWAVLPFNGTVVGLTVKANGTAGAGESFTYTLRKNGSGTALTCVVGGATDTGAGDATHSVAVTTGDRIAIELVASAAASARRHAVSVRVTT